jgi:hypothetical protein
VRKTKKKGERKKDNFKKRKRERRGERKAR